MGEAKKEEVFEFIKTFPGEKFTVQKIADSIEGISYSTVLKWVSVLDAEGVILVEDYGNVKLVSYVKEDKK